MYGELHPVGGGDPIPLLKVILLVGRRESSDIVLRFPNVSGNHCELELVEGYWYVNDLNSRNGTKVNGERVKKQRLIPDDKLSIARHVCLTLLCSLGVMVLIGTMRVRITSP